MYQKILRTIVRNRYSFELAVCATVGIIFGCVTQSVYGNGENWNGVIDRYCSGFFSAFCTVAPVTVLFIAGFFIAAPFEYLRFLIYPAEAIRAMGFGALLCGAVQCGNLRGLCFVSLVLLPYAAVNCVISVYAGEYALGLRESFTAENEGMTNSLIYHTVKMALFYILLASLSCVLLGGACVLFAEYLI